MMTDPSRVVSQQPCRHVESQKLDVIQLMCYVCQVLASELKKKGQPLNLGVAEGHQDDRSDEQVSIMEKQIRVLLSEKRRARGLLIIFSAFSGYHSRRFATLHWILRRQPGFGNDVTSVWTLFSSGWAIWSYSVRLGVPISCAVVAKEKKIGTVGRDAVVSDADASAPELFGAAAECGVIG